MIFPARIKQVGGSLMITIPNEVVEKFKLKAEQIKSFAITEDD